MSSIDSNLIFEQYCTIIDALPLNVSTISEDTPRPPVADTPADPAPAETAPAAPGAAAGELKDYPPGTQIVYNNAVYTLPPRPLGTVEINTEDPNANINVIDSNGAPFTLPYQATVNGIANKTVTVTPPAPEAGAGAGAEEPKEVDPQANMAGWGKAGTAVVDNMAANAGSKDAITKGILGGVSKLVQGASQKAPEQKKGFRKY